MSGTSISAVTEWDLFLMLRTQFSDRRPMPPKRSWVFPLISTGRPAVSGFIFSTTPVVDRQHVVARRLDQPQALQFVQLLRHLLGQVVGLAPVLARCRRAPRRRRRTATVFSPMSTQGVPCFVTAVQPLW